MFIKKIELQGFKSFPDRTKIIFHPGITCVVGPNGTGKSNIVDALLWVLGGQRVRSQRAERGGDVIFNGNQKKPPQGMADVTLFLEDDKEQLQINHRLFRSAESEYRLNGKMVRLKDIQDALWKRSISEKEYFVIEQGQIGLFLTSKPVEKRLLLEEAAGTAFYKDKKKQAENKLETSEQNLIRLEDIMAEVSRAKNSLRRQALAAARYKKLREKIRQLTALLYQKKIVQLERNIQDISRQYQSCLGEETEAISRLKAEEKNLAQKRTEVWNLEKSIKEAQKSLYSQRAETSRMETEREKEAKRIEFFEEKKKRAAENLREFEEELLELDKERAEDEENLKILSQTLSEKQQTLKGADDSSRKFQEKVSSSEGKLRALRNEFLEKLAEHTEAKNEGMKFEKEKELILRQEEKLCSELQKEETLLRQIEEKLKQRTKELEESRQLKDENIKAIETQKGVLAEILASIESLERKISEWERKKGDEVHHLQSLELMESKEKVTDSYQEIPEALGLFADLIESDAEYAPLVDVFWREETKATLVHAADFAKILSERNLKGRFLLLSPQKKVEFASEVLNDPLVLGFFKSHLRMRPEIKEHLSQLEDAVITKDIRSAVQLWLRFPALNYITVEGDLLLSSGLLKLGEKKEGAFHFSQEIKKSKEKIFSMERELEPLKLEHKEKNEQKQRLDVEVEKHSSALVEISAKTEEIEKESKFDQTEREKIGTRIQILKNELSVCDKDKETLEERIHALNLRVEELKEEEDGLKKKLEEEEKEYASGKEDNELGKKAFFELKASIDLIQEKINNLNRQLLAQKRRKETLLSRLNSLQEEIRNSEEEISKTHKNIDGLSERIKTQEEERKKEEGDQVGNESRFLQMKKEQEEMEKIIERRREECEAKKEERVKREISKAEADRDLVNLDESCWQDLKKTLQEVKEEIPEEKALETNIEEKLASAEEELQKHKSVNLLAEEEYADQKKRHDFLLQQKKDLRDSIDATHEAIRKIDEESKIQFTTAMAEVNKNLQDVFSILFNGGTAELKLVDPNEPLESGVDIVAQPPGKKVQSLTLLSGGEKSLTSLAFFFALFRYKPTPFCILDEVDAALDDVNLTRFLELMKKVKAHTQFILITHNTKTMEVADYIYGTTMAEPNITRLYSIKLEKKEGLNDAAKEK